MELDIYDFDKTVVPFDSGSLFWGFCMLRYPWIILFVPFQLICAILLILKIISFTQFKKVFFCFIMVLPVEKAVCAFWNRHEKQVFDWFLSENRKRYACVISASPDFLLSEIQKRLGFEKLICTRHDKNGVIIGENCRDEEKVRRFREEFLEKDVTVCDVYSDSLKHDRPIFSLGKRCFNVKKGGERILFEYKDVYKVS